MPRGKDKKISNMSRSRLCAMIQRMAMENAKLKSRIKKLKMADFWFDVDNGRDCVDSLSDAMCDADYNKVYEFEPARRLPTQYIVKQAINEVGDWELRNATQDEIAAYKAEQKRHRDEQQRK